MSNIDPTTPQLKVVDRLFEAYRTFDTSNAAPFLSKNFAYRSFPETTGLSEKTKEEHLELYQPIFARMSKLEVRIWHRGTIFGHPGCNLPLLAQVP